MIFKRRVLLAAIICGLSAFVPNLAIAGHGSTVLLTVTGELSMPSRGGYDEASDKFFGYHEVDFQQAATFDYSDLTGFGMESVKADFPEGGEIHTFEGPLLADVLAAAGATGKMVTVQALDGYSVEVALEELLALGAVLAVKRDGKVFGIGDFGPIQLVFPRAERDDLADMSDDNWVWSIFHISVQ